VPSVFNLNGWTPPPPRKNPWRIDPPPPQSKKKILGKPLGRCRMWFCWRTVWFFLVQEIRGYNIIIFATYQQIILLFWRVCWLPPPLPRSEQNFWVRHWKQRALLACFVIDYNSRIIICFPVSISLGFPFYGIFSCEIKVVETTECEE
jgi:hypothetical protein